MSTNKHAFGMNMKNKLAQTIITNYSPRLLLLPPRAMDPWLQNLTPTYAHQTVTRVMFHQLGS